MYSRTKKDSTNFTKREREIFHISSTIISYKFVMGAPIRPNLNRVHLDGV